MSKEGFFGPAAFFHHRHPPTGWTEFTGPLQPRAFDLDEAAGERGAVPWSAARSCCANAHCRIRYWRLPVAHAAPRAQCRRRRAAVRPRGRRRPVLRLRPPRLSRPATTSCCRAARCGASNCARRDRRADDRGHQLELPCCRTRAWSGNHAIFDPAVLDTPRIDAEFLRAAVATTARWQVEVKRRNALSLITYPFNPLDAVGWHGELSVVRLNVRDIRPLMSHRYHLPPSAHTTFLANRFVVCTFAPRPFETDPGALKVPFFHNNDDYDEVIFYHAGDFFSRDNIHPGMMTLPSGRLHARAAPEGADAHVPADQARHGRVRGHDRHARSRSTSARAPCRSSGPATWTAGRAGREARLAAQRQPRRAAAGGEPRPRARGAGAARRAQPAGGARRLASGPAAARAGGARDRGWPGARQLSVPGDAGAGAAAPRAPLGGRLGLRQPRRARAQGARRGDAGHASGPTRSSTRAGPTTSSPPRPTCRCRARNTASTSRPRWPW